MPPRKWWEGVYGSKSTGQYTPSSAHRLLTKTTPFSVLPMLASHCLPMCAVCLPHLRSPCSSMTKTPSLPGAVEGSSSKSWRRRSSTSRSSHPDSERNHCKPCASLRRAPATGSVFANAVSVLLRSAGSSNPYR